MNKIHHNSIPNQKYVRGASTNRKLTETCAKYQEDYSKES